MNLNIEVPDELEAVLKARASAQGVSTERIVSQVLEDAFAGEIGPSTTQLEGVRHIWEVIADNMQDVPLAELEKLPKDGASQVDHYLYGHPGR